MVGELKQREQQLIAASHRLPGDRHSAARSRETPHFRQPNASLPPAKPTSALSKQLSQCWRGEKRKRNRALCKAHTTCLFYTHQYFSTTTNVMMQALQKETSSYLSCVLYNATIKQWYGSNCDRIKCSKKRMNNGGMNGGKLLAVRLKAALWLASVNQLPLSPSVVTRNYTTSSIISFLFPTPFFLFLPTHTCSSICTSPLSYPPKKKYYSPPPECITALKRSFCCELWIWRSKTCLSNRREQKSRLVRSYRHKVSSVETAF